MLSREPWRTGANAEATLLLMPCFWGELVVWELDIKRGTITCLPVTSPYLCPVEGLWRTAGNCTKGIQASPTCCCRRTPSPSAWSFSHKKRSDTKGSLVLFLLAANCSLYIFPWFLRKPVGLVDCSTSQSHTWNDALQQDDGTKIFLRTSLTCFVVHFGFSPKFCLCMLLGVFSSKHIHHTTTFSLFLLSVQPESQSSKLN